MASCTDNARQHNVDPQEFGLKWVFRPGPMKCQGLKDSASQSHKDKNTGNINIAINDYEQKSVPNRSTCVRGHRAQSSRWTFPLVALAPAHDLVSPFFLVQRGITQWPRIHAWQHGGSVVSAVASQQEGSSIKPDRDGVCMFSHHEDMYVRVRRTLLTPLTKALAPELVAPTVLWLLLNSYYGLNAGDRESNPGHSRRAES